jgi:hypothetical protein
MALAFVAIDPNTGGDNCPAVFVEEETGDLLFQGWTVTDPQTLADISRHSPIADNESVVRSRRACGQSSWRRSMAKVPPFSELIAATTTSAVHLEMRDAYTPDDPQFLDWLAGKPIPSQPFRTGTSLCEPMPHGASGSGVPGSSQNRFRISPGSSTPSRPASTSRPVSRCAGLGDAEPLISASQVTTSGCLMTGSSGSATSQATAISSITSWMIALPS